MLKTRDGNSVWLVDQPSHAALSGLLAAHWGNAEFARPGEFLETAFAREIRSEAVLGIEQHDNGWWEWEAAPQEGEDGLPLGLAELVQQPLEGLDRWRLGVRRLAAQHPFASLLIGDHARFLYEPHFTDNFPPELVHPISSARRALTPSLEDAIGSFLSEIRDFQQELEGRLQAEAFGRAALEQRLPHSRLLQILDSFSLALCSALLGPRGLGRDEMTWANVPRRHWDDRVEMRIVPRGDGCVAVDPFPFGEAPLDVSVPARRVQSGWWRASGWELLRFRLQRA